MLKPVNVVSIRRETFTGSKGLGSPLRSDELSHIDGQKKGFRSLANVLNSIQAQHAALQRAGVLPSDRIEILQIAPDDKAPDLTDTQSMSETTEYRHELSLRDAQLQREMDRRQESFRAEQAVRDKALEDRFAGFLLAQAERDKAWEKISEARFDRIEKDVSSIKADTKKVSEDINGIKLTMAKYLGGAIVIGAVASAVLGAAARNLIS